MEKQFCIRRLLKQKKLVLKVRLFIFYEPNHLSHEITLQIDIPLSQDGPVKAFDPFFD